MRKVRGALLNGHKPARQTTFSEAKRLVRRSSAQKQGFRFLLCRDGKVSAYSGVRLDFFQKYSSACERGRHRLARIAVLRTSLSQTCRVRTRTYLVLWLVQLEFRVGLCEAVARSPTARQIFGAVAAAARQSKSFRLRVTESYEFHNDSWKRWKLT